jgi:Zn-dependent protease with chaperone function
METIALLFALLLLVLFGWGIIENFFAVAFGYQDLLLYAGVALVVYLIIRAVGGSLNKKFNQSVKDFLDGKKKVLFDDKGLLRTFGFLLFLLLPLLLYLLAVALFAAIDFGLYGLLAISNIPRIPIAVPIGLGIVVIGTGISVLIGIYYLFFPPKRKTLGIEIKKGEEKKLWDITREIAIKIKAKPIDKIVITPDPGIGVYLEGNLFSTIFGGGKRVLEIGLPSMHDLTTNDFKAILAHEYGHFSNRDTQWSSFTYTVGNSLIRTLQSMPGPSRDENEEVGIVRGIMSFNPAYWLLFLYVELYFKITNGFSRIREVMADIHAMELYGGRSFSSGLLKVSINDAIFSEIIQREWVRKLLKEGKTISNFSKFMEAVMEAVYNLVDKKIINELISNLLQQSESHGAYDSHPALKVRIDYAKKFAEGDEKNTETASQLFDNWDNINEKVAELYNLRLFLDYAAEKDRK